MKIKQKLRIDQLSQFTFLAQLQIQPGQIIHLQDSRLQKKEKKEEGKKDMTQFVRKDFAKSREARASF